MAWASTSEAFGVICGIASSAKSFYPTHARNPCGLLCLFFQQQVPGLAVGMVDGFRVLGRQVQSSYPGDAYGDWDDVPEIQRNNVGGHEVKVVRGVESAPATQHESIVLEPSAHGGLDLNTQKMAIALDDEVVVGGIAPGFSDDEAVLGGADHETHLGPLAVLFGVFDVHSRT